MDAKDAWTLEQVPIANAVTFGDGRMILLEVLTAEDGAKVVRALAETTFDSFIKYNPDWLSDVTCVAEVDVPNVGKLQAGEAAEGAEGFVALCDADGSLVYCIFCTSSNPFAKLTLSRDNSTVRALTTSGVEWSFAIATPWRIETRVVERFGSMAYPHD